MRMRNYARSRREAKDAGAGEREREREQRLTRMRDKYLSISNLNYLCTAPRVKIVFLVQFDGLTVITPLSISASLAFTLWIIIMCHVHC